MDIDIELMDNVINQQDITILFQPIVSVKNKSTFGVEALCRGHYKNQVIYPYRLFDIAKRTGRLDTLDKLCRHKALEEYVKFKDDGLVLFLNFEASLLEDDELDTKSLFEFIEENNLDPQNIVIEINETYVSNVDTLIRFIEKYREMGFVIALDDVGKGHSNMDRIASAKPDIVKVDMDIISGIDRDFYKQEILRALVDMSMKIGAVTVAEGVELFSEAITCLEIGVNYIQGFYFSRPVHSRLLDRFDFDTKISSVAISYKTHKLRKIIKQRSEQQSIIKNVMKIKDRLRKLDVYMYGPLLKSCLQEYADVECLYVLNDMGIQVSETVVRATDLKNGFLFSPAPRGTDHSMKDYFYMAFGLNTDIYTTDFYLSSATGNLCRTYSTKYKDESGKLYILCVDILHNPQI